MDTKCARIQGTKGIERVRSMPFMLIKPSRSKGRWRPFGPEGIKARLTGDQVMQLLTRH